MEEEYNPRKAFEEYEAAQKEAGIPVDPRAARAAKRELEEGRKTDYAVYGEELDRAEKIAGYPKGRLGETGYIDEEVPAKGASVLNPPKEEKPDEFRHPETNQTQDEMEGVKSQLQAAKKLIESYLQTTPVVHKIPDNIQLALDTISFRYGIYGLLSSVPDKIEDKIEEIDNQLKFFKNFSEE